MCRIPVPLLQSQLVRIHPFTIPVDSIPACCTERHGWPCRPLLHLARPNSAGVLGTQQSETPKKRVANPPTPNSQLQNPQALKHQGQLRRKNPLSIPTPPALQCTSQHACPPAEATEVTSSIPKNTRLVRRCEMLAQALERSCSRRTRGAFPTRHFSSSASSCATCWVCLFPHRHDLGQELLSAVYRLHSCKIAASLPRQKQPVLLDFFFCFGQRDRQASTQMLANGHSERFHFCGFRDDLNSPMLAVYDIKTNIILLRIILGQRL